MTLYVNSYVVINDGCPLAISVSDPNHVEIVCGWTPHRAFEFVLQREALRSLIELGTEALESMDAAHADDKVTGQTVR